MLSKEQIERVYGRMVGRQGYESRWILADGNEVATDVGYAIEGAHLFLEELLIEAEKESIK